jgi:hypothetical protein
MTSAATVVCPSCKEETPGDGKFCDQCAGVLNICPKCGTVTAGAFCPRDRTPLTAAAAPKPRVPMPPPRTAPPARVMTEGATTRGTAPDATPPKPLTFSPLNAAIVPIDVLSGDQLGRAVGRHAAVLATLHDRGLSSRHARVDWSAASGWTITDIGSSFGIDVRADTAWPTPEHSIPRDVPHPLAVGQFVRIGDLFFKVT